LNPKNKKEKEKTTPVPGDLATVVAGGERPGEDPPAGGGESPGCELPRRARSLLREARRCTADSKV